MFNIKRHIDMLAPKLYSHAINFYKMIIYNSI